ncbi:4-(cytidine 5'-diphospho)-2-C-methyl-D-erythritol kinase [Halalkalibacillus halophilus]|uniref:4-(cytidine 5'-diphospho)-2-C-methyl-D-erythritol kinase n=1 Tax=Halalkalibacillus halophilus TaxID=392827 RepID=UPI0003F86748|nr:4-(cytidine 5'-diphospho)-2-C-methyl-D-erythritol kinase [Halalkalibacillus halophilus]
MILEKAPAKINLTLDVLRKRDDGYHEVEMIMTQVDLADRLSFEKIQGNQIVIESESRFVPNDRRNLAYQAAKLLMERMGVKAGVKITIDKKIPVAAGLAGGSTDAAAAFRGINRLFDLGCTYDTLGKLSEELGSDIPFCIQGGTQLATGRGEKLTKLPSLPSCWVVLAKPNIGVSTRDVYKRVDLTSMDHPNTKAAKQELENQHFKGICAELKNVLEPITASMYRDVAKIKSQMENAGADGVLMSGSGPTVFALAKQESKANRIYNQLKGFCQEVYVVRSLN